MIPSRPVESRPAPVTTHSVHSLSTPDVRRIRTALYDDPILVTIASASVRKRFSVYTILVYDAVGRTPYKVERRYSDFFALRSAISKKLGDMNSRKCPGCHSLANFVDTYDFPKRQLLFAGEAQIVRQRALSLRGFIRELTHRAVSPNIIRCPLCASVAESIRHFLADDGDQYDLVVDRSTNVYGRPTSLADSIISAWSSWGGNREEEIYRFDLDIGSFTEYLVANHARDKELLQQPPRVPFKGWNSIVDRRTGIAQL